MSRDEYTNSCPHISLCNNTKRGLHGAGACPSERFDIECISSFHWVIVHLPLSGIAQCLSGLICKARTRARHSLSRRPCQYRSQLQNYLMLRPRKSPELVSVQITYASLLNYPATFTETWAESVVNFCYLPPPPFLILTTPLAEMLLERQESC